jgi:DNA-binding YbaB/EbfC family protein
MQPDLNQMMRQAAKMQREMEKIQDELNKTPVEGSAGGGAVKVTCTGAIEFTKIKLSAEAVDPNDIETLEDLILTAIKDASQKAKDLAQGKMGKLQLPPGLGF